MKKIYVLKFNLFPPLRKQKVPLTLAKKYSSFKGGIDFVVSFAFGAGVVTLAAWAVYLPIRRFAFHQSAPELHWRVMAVPGSISGLLWSIGNYFSIYAVLELGEGLGYGCVQGAIIVSGLWGILYYKVSCVCVRGFAPS